jgi:hypothetical protein
MDPADGRIPFVQPLEVAHIFVPGKVQLSADRTRVEWQGPNRPDPVGLRPSCLDEFINLDGGSVDSVVTFVRKWGPLALNPRGEAPDFDTWTSEAIEVYAQRSRQLRAVLSIVAALKQGERTEPEDWDAATLHESDIRFSLTAFTFEGSDWPSEAALKWQIARLITEVILPEADIVPVVRWTTGRASAPASSNGPPEHCPFVTLAVGYGRLNRWLTKKGRLLTKYFKADPEDIEGARRKADLAMEVEPRPSVLFSVLALQLAAVVASGAFYCACSICGTWHYRVRRPGPGNAYCGNCKQVGNTLRKRNARREGKSN